MVSEGYAFRNGSDPVFWEEEADYIQCDTCGETYDYNGYKSFTCVECENQEVIQEKKAREESNGRN